MNYLLVHDSHISTNALCTDDEISARATQSTHERLERVWVRRIAGKVMKFRENL
jgi:hypothetical protein